MSFWLWEKLPAGFLKIKQRRWSALDYDVKLLINRLAHEQGFKCAHCKQTRNLEIEHDHCPEHGPGDEYTIYNIRGLVCRACNWHVGMLEAKNRGEYNGWSDVFPRVSDDNYHSYIYAYECRVSPLLEALLEERLGSRNYWRRRNLLWKFDDWKEWGGRKKQYPWYWGFDVIKDKKYGHFRTQKQTLHFLRTVEALARYAVEHPEYKPSEAFLELMLRLKPVFEALKPIVEARLSNMGQSEDDKRDSESYEPRTPSDPCSPGPLHADAANAEVQC